ncbi:hypothetical protein CARUB_v10016147mg, partial [Capsella rubella]
PSYDFEGRVAAVGIATQSLVHRNKVFRINEEIETAKTQEVFGKDFLLHEQICEDED